MHTEHKRSVIGHWSLGVSAKWRITLRFRDGDV